MIAEGRNIPSTHLWIFGQENNSSNHDRHNTLHVVDICGYEMPTIPAPMLLQWLVQPSDSILQLMVMPLHSSCVIPCFACVTMMLVQRYCHEQTTATTATADHCHIMQGLLCLSTI